MRCTLVRRWNTDPEVKHHESPYAAFANNPIWFIDHDGRDTLVMHRKSLGVANGAEIFRVTFSVVKNGIEMMLENVMYMGSNAKYIRIPDNRTYKLSYDRTMRHHPEWEDLSIHVEGF